MYLLRRDEVESHTCFVPDGKRLQPGDVWVCDVCAQHYLSHLIPKINVMNGHSIVVWKAISAKKAKRVIARYMKSKGIV